MKRCIILPIILVLAGCGSLNVTVDVNFDHKIVKKVAVLPFRFAPDANRSWNYLVAAHLVYTDAGKLSSEIFTTSLLGMGRYRLIERSNLDALLREKDLGDADLLDVGAAREIGKVLGVDAIVMGSVNDASMNWVAFAVFARSSLNIKCVHVETGTVLWSASGLNWLFFGTPEGRASALSAEITCKLKTKLDACESKKGGNKK